MNQPEPERDKSAETVVSVDSYMIGEKLADRYQLTGELGRGGMGVVYRAFDPRLDREVAVKLVPPNMFTGGLAERLEREAKTIARMDHPGIVPVYDIGVHHELHFFVMPLIGGKTLRQMIKAGEVTQGQALEISVQVAEALAYSHALGVLHRDVKPANVMVVPEEGGVVRAKVMDFGLAKGDHDVRLTGSDDLVGTIAYMSPEQVTRGKLDERSDIYSLGVVIYESLSGVLPIRGRGLQSKLQRIAYEVPPTLRSMGIEISRDLDDYLQTLLAKKPDNRPQRASDVAQRLRRFLGGLGKAEQRTRSVAEVRDEGQMRMFETPLVGRLHELSRLQARLALAVEGECQLVVVEGDVGLGKKRLLSEFEDLLRPERTRVLHGRFAEQDRRFPYHAFCELIQDFFRSKEVDPSSSGFPEISDLSESLVSLFPVLSEISFLRSASTSSASAGAPWRSGVPEEKSFIFEILARTLSRLSSGQPMILLLEDLHQGDLSIEALEYVVRRLGPTPILIVGTCSRVPPAKNNPVRQLLDGFSGGRNFEHLRLHALTPGESALLIGNLLGDVAPDEDLCERIYSATDGNPLLTRELVRAFVESEALIRDESLSWRISEDHDPAWHDLPATIQQAVERRIEGLPENLVEILTLASILGREFDYPDLDLLVGERHELEDDVDQLVVLGLLEDIPGVRSDRLCFSGGVLRDVLYGRLTRRRRRVLHRKYATLLEERMEDRPERVSHQLLHHFEHGDVPDKVVQYGLLAAEMYVTCFSARDAIRSCRTVLEFLDDERWFGEPTADAEARFLLSQALRLNGELEMALKEAARAATGFQDAGRTVDAARVALHAAETAWEGRRIQETTYQVDRGIELVKDTGASEIEIKLRSLAATLANLHGDHETGERHLKRARSLDEQGPLEPTPTSGGRLTVALTTPARASEPSHISLEDEAEVLGNVFETLVNTDDEGHACPRLSDNWEALDEGRSFLFHLRRDVTFQDGEPLTAALAKASLERAVQAGEDVLNASLASIRRGDGGGTDIAGLRAVDEHTLRIDLGERVPIFPVLLSNPNAAITRVVADRSGREQVLGTGPFRIHDFAEERILLERHEGYWRGTPAYLKHLEFRMGLSEAQIAEGLRTEEIDLARDLTGDDLDRLMRDARFRSKTVERPKKNIYFIFFNCNSNRASSRLLRRALAGVIRPRDLVLSSVGHFCQPAAGLIPPGVLGHDPGRRWSSLGWDDAKTLLGGAMEGKGIRLRAAVHPVFQDRHRGLLRAILKVWSDLGIEVDEGTSSMAEFLEACEDPNGFDMTFGRWNADYDDPDDFTYSLFHSKMGHLRKHFSSVETDDLGEKGRAEPRSSLRKNYYRRFEKSLADAAAVIPLFHDMECRIKGSRVGGLKLLYSAPYVNYSEVFQGQESASTHVQSSVHGVLNIPTTGMLSSLDPVEVDTRTAAEILPNVYECLVRITAGARVRPWLLEEYESDHTNTCYRFKLRSGVRFHSGARLTSRDVRYSFERALQKGSRQGRMLDSIQGAANILRGVTKELAGFRLLSSTRFEIVLSSPNSIFPKLLSHPTTAIVPEGSDPTTALGSGKSLGTGPFKIAHFEPGDRIELTANRAYWREGFPRSEALVFWFGIATQEIAAEFRAGRFSAASQLPARDIDALRQDSTLGAGFQESPGLSTVFLQFNCKKGPLADPAVRTALSRLLQPEDLISHLGSRMAAVADSLIPPALLRPVAVRRSSRSGIIPRPGLPDGLELKVAILPVGSDLYNRAGQWICSRFEEAGVKVSHATHTLDEFRSALTTGDVDFVIGRWQAEYPDADSFFHGLFQSRSGALSRFFSSSSMDAAIDSGRRESDPVERDRFYRNLLQTIARQAALLPLYYERQYRFVQSNIGGLRLRMACPFVAYEDLARR